MPMRNILLPSIDCIDCTFFFIPPEIEKPSLSFLSFPRSLALIHALSLSLPRAFPHIFTRTVIGSNYLRCYHYDLLCLVFFTALTIPVYRILRILSRRRTSSVGLRVTSCRNPVQLVSRFGLPCSNMATSGYSCLLDFNTPIKIRHIIDLPALMICCCCW